MPGPSLVILSEAKNLRSSLRVDSTKHPCSWSNVEEVKKQLQRSFARRKARRAQDDMFPSSDNQETRVVYGAKDPRRPRCRHQTREG
jgi:hypothetical protein